MFKTQQHDWKDELGAILITGGIPILLGYLYGGLELVTTVIEGLKVNDWLLYYIACCSVAFALIAFLDHRFDFSLPVLEKAHNRLSGILLESVNSLNGVLRVTSGMLCALTVLGIILDFKMEDISFFSYIGFIGIAAGFESYILAKFIIYAKTKWLKNAL